jgi:hypothetical protein
MNHFSSRSGKTRIRNIFFNFLFIVHIFKQNSKNTFRIKHLSPKETLIIVFQDHQYTQFNFLASIYGYEKKILPDTKQDPYLK